MAVPTILLVEDSPTQAAITRMALEKLGTHVMHAASATTALSTVSANAATISLVVLDRNLPDRPGLDVCRVLKANTFTRSIPVVMFSQEDRLKAMSEAYAAGADYYVAKGSDGDDTLVMLVDTLLKRLARRATGGTLPERATAR